MPSRILVEAEVEVLVSEILAVAGAGHVASGRERRTEVGEPLSGDEFTSAL